MHHDRELRERLKFRPGDLIKFEFSTLADPMYGLYIRSDVQTSKITDSNMWEPRSTFEYTSWYHLILMPTGKIERFYFTDVLSMSDFEMSVEQRYQPHRRQFKPIRLDR